ncbi:Cof-type HAD-IIB family hydrolase [Mycoplasma tullyi]|uniref:Cof-type HAD-IIB family hydrolase n=1 Tax=Mycoplasma tullyi TaxID=1612150 RepID=A0A7D7Y4P4_9MOLU|nr:Cof-type HAD-IIB family hydrolase [Mycoplasma tullyi]QMT98397.1 Cof-type HAD-IIB family hydrolase [Mycoplasma tullyi]
MSDLDKSRQLKLIGIDLDGTLLSIRKKVTKKVINSLLDLRKKLPDVVIAIITGRSYLSAKRVVNELQTAGVKIDYLCSYNGSVLFKVNEQSELTKLYEHSVDSETTKVIFDYCKKNKIAFQGYLVTDQVNSSVVLSDNFIGRIIASFNKNKSFCTKEFVEGEYYKINLISTKRKRLAEFNGFVAKNYADSVEIANVFPTFLEITTKNINKAFALRKVCDLENISLDQTAAIGDSLNDYSMFEIASYKFAMKRANPKLKNISTYIAHSSRHNQFKEIIQKTISIVDDSNK